MSRYSNFNIFPYQWSNEDIESNQGLRSIIRIYGFNEINESVYVCIEDFDTPVWVELPDNMEWTDSRVRMIAEKIKTMNYKFKPSDVVYEMRHRLYFAQVNKIDKTEGSSNIKYERKKFPYLKVNFASVKAAEIFIMTLKKEVQIMGIGPIKLKPHYDRKITPEIRMAAIQRLPTAGWIKGKGIKSSPSDKETTRKHEYICSYKNLVMMEEKLAMKMPIVYPKVLSFDNEANSTIWSSMPKAERPNDKTFQIGVTILDPPKGGKPKTYTKYLFSMGPHFNLEDATVISCKTEADLYIAFSEFIVEHDPDVIIGFNILGWDIPYMIDRCNRSFCNCIDKFSKFGCIEGVKAKETIISWSSSAYGKQEFKFLNAEGRLFIDLLPYIKKNYKLPNYRLETICEEFLKNTNKDPLKPKDIFKCFKDFTSESLAKCGKYCVQDSYVTTLLYEKLNTWFDLTESATTNRVPIFDMIAQGQQQKMYSQVYEYCYHNNMVVETDAFRSADDEHYTGAFVSTPVKGLYKNIIPLDFSSLYPSLIRAYNIDYSKMVTDPLIPDDDCHVMTWAEHKFCGCPYDTKKGEKAPKGKDGLEKRVCAEYKYRWLKHQVSGKGVVPILLETVLDARKRTRKVIEAYEGEIKVMKKLISGDKFLPEEKDTYDKMLEVGDHISKIIDDLELEEIEEADDIYYAHTFQASKADYKSVLKARIEHLEMMNNVLDMRQKAFKVNANSMYGAMGVRQGKLPFLPGAMCVTFMGRENIIKVNKFVHERKNGKVIYNDTDSAYCYFPEFDDKPIKELWKYVEDIVKEIKVLFPAPMSLEFEGKVYRKFLILTKKRYVALPVDIEGKGNKLFKRGIVLQRRDNCKLLREVYQELVMKVFQYHEELVGMKSLQLKEKIKQAASIDILNLISFSLDTLFQWKYGYRDFVITKQMTKVASDYKNPDKLPSHVLLGLKMQKRGIPVGAGSRIEYLITKIKEFKKTDTQKDKLVDVDYFAEFRDIMRISYLDYLKQFINPIDEMLEVVLGVEDFVKKNFDYRIKYSKVVDQINNLGAPRLIFNNP